MKQAILYTTPTCPKCHALAIWLDKQGIDFTTRNLANPAVLTDLRLDCCFEVQAPILKVGCMYYPAGWLYEGDVLQEEKLQKALEEA
jgi:hypothetical protein